MMEILAKAFQARAAFAAAGPGAANRRGLSFRACGLKF
jgi:hypothetical protein